MASRLDEFNQMKIEIAKAIAKGDRAFLNEKIHVVDHNKERARKQQNPKQSTRIVFNARTPEAWKEFQTQKDRFFEAAVDPHIAVDLITRAMQQVTDEQLAAWVKDEDHSGEEVPPEPDWLRD